MKIDATAAAIRLLDRVSGLVQLLFSWRNTARSRKQVAVQLAEVQSSLADVEQALASADRV